MPLSNPKDKLQWSHSRSSYLAGICVISGFVNFWRFPELLATYGASYFVPVYLLALVTLALPVVLLQWRIGRSMKGSSLTALMKLAEVGDSFSIWKLTGGLMLLAAALTAGIYVSVAGLSFAYIFQAALGQLNSVDAEGAATILQTFQIQHWQWVVWFSLFTAVAYIVSVRGVIEGLERVLPYLVSTLFLLLLILVAYALTRAATGTSIELLFAETQYSWSLSIWMDAYLQAFFSVGLGTGVHFILGAYCTAGIKDSRMMGLILCGDFLIAMLAAIAVYPLLVGADLAVGGGLLLVFQSIPVAFQGAPAGAFFLALYYLILTLLALTSVLFLVEPVIHALQTGLKLHRRIAVALVYLMLWCFVLVLVQMISSEAADPGQVSWFTVIQFVISAFLLPFSLLLMLALCVFVVPASRLASVMGKEEDDFRQRLVYQWTRYIVIPLVFLVLVWGLVGVLRFLCLVGGPFAGSICVM